MFLLFLMTHTLKDTAFPMVHVLKYFIISLVLDLEHTVGQPLG